MFSTIAIIIFIGMVVCLLALVLLYRKGALTLDKDKAKVVFQEEENRVEEVVQKAINKMKSKPQPKEPS